MIDKEKEDIGFNTKCENFKQKLIDDINSCDIPIAPAYYIFQSLYQEVEKTYYGILNTEAVEHPEIVREKEETESQ